MILSNKSKGIICILGSALGFSLMTVFAKAAGDIPFTQKMFFRNIVAFAASGIILFRNKGFSIKKELIPLYYIRSITGTLGMICTFYALDKMLLADVTILLKLAPFFTVIMSYFILSERIDAMRVLIIIGAFAGSAFVINPSFESFSINLPALIAILAASLAGTAYTLVRKLGQRGADGASVVFFFSGFSTLVAIPLFAFTYEPMSIIQVSMLLCAGLSATLGQFSVTKAYMYAPAREISVFDYTQIIFAALFGFFLYGEIPSGYSFIGYGIIVSMAIASFVYTRKLEKS